MDTLDTTNPTAEAPEAEAPEVETTESEDLTPDESADVTDEGDEAPEEEEELDIDGNPIRLPKTLAEKLKARMMMQADYTQKTQAIAEQRKAIEAERQAVQWENETRAALFNEEAQLLTVRQRLEQFQGVNWAALAQQDMQQHAVLNAEYTQLKDYHDRLNGHVEGRRNALAQQREQATAITLQSAVQQLNTPDPSVGWDGKFDADKATKITDFLVKRGANPDYLRTITDPLVIKIAHLAMLGEETLRKNSAALKKPATPEAKPVTMVATGKTRTGPSNPDRLSAENWVKWRESELAKRGGKGR